MNPGKRLSVLTQGAVVAAAILVAGIGSTAQAASRTWNNSAGNMLWDNLTSANWTGSTWNNANPDSAVFAGAGQGTITLNSAITAGGATTITFSSNGYTISGANTLTLTTAVISFGSGISATNSCPITQNGNMTLNGGGSLNLTGVDTRPNGISTSVGDTSGNNTLIVSGTGRMAISGNGGSCNLNIGTGAGGNNSVTFSSAALTSTYKGSCYIGSASSGNSLSVSAGHQLYVQSGLTLSATASGGNNNSLLVTGSGTAVFVNNNNGSQFNVGGDGSGDPGDNNNATFSGGAQLTSTKLYVGWSSAGQVTTGNWVRVTGDNGAGTVSKIQLAGNGPSIRIAQSANATGNYLQIDSGGWVNAAVSGSTGQGIGHATGANSNYISIYGVSSASVSSLLSDAVTVPFVIGGVPAGAGMPPDAGAPMPSGNHLDVYNGGVFTVARNVYLMGTLSAINLGNGTGVGTMNVGAAPSVATDPNVVLYKADSLLNVNGGRLVAGAGGKMVSGAGTVVISGPAYFKTDQVDSTITCAITGSSGTLIKDGTGAGGILTCSNLSGFSGGLSVNFGRLNITGALAASMGALTVSSGTQLGLVDGAGRTLTVSGLNLTGASTVYLERAGGSFDKIAGGAASASGTITIDLGSPAGVPDGDYDLITASGGLNGASWTLANAGGGSILTSATAIQVHYGASEPAWDPAGYWYGGVASPGNAMSATNWSRTNTTYVSSSLTPSATANIEFCAAGATQQGNIVLGSSMGCNAVTINEAITIAADGNALTINGSVTNNESAVINAGVVFAGSSPSSVTIAAGKTLTLGGAVSGNAIAKNGSGTLRLTATNTLGNLPQINTGTLSIENGGKLTLAEVPITANNNITVKVDGNGSRLYKTAATYWIIGNTGAGNTLIVTNGAAMWFYNAGEQYQQQQAYIGNQAGADNNAVIITGAGSVWQGMRETFVGNGSGSSGNSIQLLNGGRIDSSGPVHLTIGSGGGNNNFVKVSGNNSFLHVSGGSGANLNVGGGTGNYLEVSDGGEASSGSFSVSGTNSINLGNGTGVGKLTIRAQGTTFISVGTDSQFNINGGRIEDQSSTSMLGGSGTVTLNGPAYFSSGGSSTIDMPMGGGSAGTVTKEGSGTVTLNAANTYSGSTIVTNGTLALGSGGSISNSPLIQLVVAGATLDVSANPSFCLLKGQELKGIGQVKGSVTNNAGSMMTPGNLIGTLTFQNNLTLNPGATNNFELGTNTTAGTTYDQVVVAGTLNVNGIGWSDFSFSTNSTFGVGSYRLFHATTALSGSLGAAISGSVGSLTGTLTLDAINKDVVLTVGTESIASGVWIRTLTGGLWNDGANWQGGVVANGAGTTADFGQVNIGTDPIVAVHVNAPKTIGNITFGDADTGSAAGWTMDNDGVATNILTLSGTPTITVNALGGANNATISAEVQATSLLKAGVGALVLSANNTNLTGTTRIAAGTLTIGNQNALQVATVDMNGADTGTLGFDSAITAATVGNLAGSRNVNLANNASGAVTLSVGNDGATTNYDGSLTGAGGLTKVGGGTLRLTGASSYLGATAIQTGAIKLQGASGPPVSGYALWLDAQDASTVHTSGPNVIQWDNKGSCGSSVTNNGAANGNYNATGINGHPSVGFDGTGGKYLMSCKGVPVYTNTGNTMSLFVVKKRNANANDYRGALSFIGPDNPSDWNHISNLSTEDQRNDQWNKLTGYRNGNLSMVDPHPAVGTAFIWATIFDGVNNIGYLSGAFVTPTTGDTQPSSGNFNITKMALGGRFDSGTGNAPNANWWNGDIGEVLIYNRALSTTERQAVEAYLNVKWFGSGSTGPGDNLLPSGTALTIASGSLDLNGINQQVASLSGAGTIDNSNADWPVALTVGDATSAAYSGAIGDTGAALTLLKVGAGKLTLSGANTYSGGTTISNGTLAVNGSVAGLVTVKATGTLAGTGTVASATMETGSTLSPGASVGKLTVTGALTLNSGAANAFELGANSTPGTTYDHVEVDGTLNLNSVGWNNFSFTALGGFAAGDYVLFAGASAPVGNLGGTTSGSIGSFNGTLHVVGKNLVLTVTGLPLPPVTVIKFD